MIEEAYDYATNERSRMKICSIFKEEIYEDFAFATVKKRKYCKYGINKQTINSRWKRNYILIQKKTVDQNLAVI